VILAEEVPSVAGLALVVWGIVSLIKMVSYLSSRGVRTSYVFVRLFALKYVNLYRTMTIEESGSTGFWFYSYVFSMLGALAMAVVLLTLT
jgi:hypothetical protein